MNRINTVNKINKVLSIIAFVLFFISAVCTLILGSAKNAVNADFVEQTECGAHVECEGTHQHAEVTAFDQVAVGDYENTLTVKGQDPATLEDASYTLEANNIVFKSPCANCGCTVNKCSQCYSSKVISGVTKYAFTCQVDEGKNCPLDITKQNWYNEIMGVTKIVDSTLLPIILVLGTAGTIYVIVLGVKFSKAESADKREEAKKHMINAIIGVVVTLLILILVKVFTKNAPAIVQWVNGV